MNKKQIERVKKATQKFADAQTFKADSQYQSECLKAAIDCLAELKGWAVQPRKDKKNK